MGKPQLLDRVTRGLADDEELALERIGHHHALSAADEDLADERLDALHRFAKPRVLDRNIAPAEEDLAFVLDGPFDFVLAREARCRLLGEEHHADPVLARLREADALGGKLFAEKRVRNLDQDPGAVARQRVGAHRPAMGEIAQDLEALLDDSMAFLPLDVRHEANAARIMLVRGVIKALPLWRTCNVHRGLSKKPNDSSGVWRAPLRCVHYARVPAPHNPATRFAALRGAGSPNRE
jgi:hypothetical protein